jgi:hypothetical protein
MKKQKLELTWIGKETRPRLEPRILLEDPEKSYHAAQRVSEDDHFDNRLIFGDNLLALKALEQEFNGKIKCVFIDPPYNTGSAFEHYDDGLEHFLWLSLMRDRLCLLRNLLREDGSIWISIDDNEGHYLKVLCDEVFGRGCFIASVIWRTSDSSNNNVTKFSLDHNEILVYAKSSSWRPINLNNPAKRTHFKNPDNDPRGPWFDGNNMQNPGLRPNLQFDIVSPTGFTIKHPPNGWRWSRETIEEKMKTGEIRFSTDGKRLIRRTYLADQVGLTEEQFEELKSLAGQVTEFVRGTKLPNSVLELERVLREVRQRLGQSEFRATLVDAYAGRCSITDCDVVDALEPAHIEPHCIVESSDPQNGLLLRADINTLFDRHLIGIHPETLTVEIASCVQGSSNDYLRGTTIRVPAKIEFRPLTAALKKRWEWFQANGDS